MQSVTWSGPAGEAFVEFGLDDALDQRTYTQIIGGGDAILPLLALKAGHSYSARAVTLGADGERYESEIFTVEAPLADVDMPRVAVTQHDSTLADGYLLTSLMREGSAHVVLLDVDGDPVWWYRFDGDVGVTSQRLSRDGHAIIAMVSDRDDDSESASIWRIELDGSAVTQTLTALGHHDFVELDDGRYAWLALDHVNVDWLVQTVVSDKIFAAEAGANAGAADLLYNAFRDLAPVERSCEHWETSAATGFGYDWTHGNSLAIFDDGDLLVGLRNLDAVVRVNPETGRSRWQAGGAHTDFAFTEGSTPWNHGHFSHAWDGGMIMIDNGDHREPPVSRVVELAWDKQAQTIEEVWSYEQPDERWVSLLGDARKLDDGDVLISWSTLGHVQRVSSNKAVRWELNGSIGVVVGRVRWIDDLYDVYE